MAPFSGVAYTVEKPFCFQGHMMTLWSSASAQGLSPIFPSFIICQHFESRLSRCMRLEGGVTGHPLLGTEPPY